MLLSLENLRLSFGGRVLLDGASVALASGERVGLIGDNGTGKTTLFRIITGKQEVDDGQVTIARGASVGVLEQDPTFVAGHTVREEAELAFGHLHELSDRLRTLEHEMGEGKDVSTAYEEATHAFEQAGGFDWRHRLDAALEGVGLDKATWGAKVEVLSGGQRSRLALAKLLVREPDVLLLDEPTNHLDLAAIAWLEGFLGRYAGAVLIISHDRHLLDRACNRIVLLERRRLASYPGNYTSYLIQRETNELGQQRAREKQQADIAKQQEFIRRFKANQRARQAAGREKRLNRLLDSGDVIEEVGGRSQINLKLGPAKDFGLAVAVENLAKGYDGRTLWRDVRFEAMCGERLGILGPNGGGKTTLLRCLLGEEPPDAGDVRWGSNLDVGYYDQKLGDYNPQFTVLEEASTGVPPGEGRQRVRDLLGALLFRGNTVEKKMHVLSGGERARVALCKLLLKGCDVLVMDEPTNHLDIASREALEAALAGFGGTVICVSHDRYFLDKVTDRLLVVQPPEGGGVIDFRGDFADWERQAEEASRPTKAKVVKPSPVVQKPKPTAAKKADNKYLRPFGTVSTEQLEEDITETEIAIAEAQDAFGDGQRMSDPAEAKRLQAEFAALTKKLEQMEAEYFERG